MKTQEEGTTTAAASTTTATAMTTIPVIDMESISAGTELIDAFKTVGFATLTNHMIDTTLINRAFLKSKQFFELSSTEKLKYKYQGPTSNRGYIPFQSETHTGTIDNPDHKETFDIGKEHNDEDGYTNHWPVIDSSTTTATTTTTTTTTTESSSNDFQSTMLEYFETFDKLFLKLMKMIAIELNMDDPNYLVDRCNQQHENLRLLHYPSIPIDKSYYNHDDCSNAAADTATTATPNTTTPPPTTTTNVIQRGNVHTDFGVLTLLCQDSVGGLRVQLVTGQWISVPPVPNSIVVNVGDMLQRWSNDMFRATPHQVVSELPPPPPPLLPLQPPPSQRTDGDDNKNVDDGDDDGAGQQRTIIPTVVVPERYSIAFFCNANKNVVLECLKECCCSSSSNNDDESTAAAAAAQQQQQQQQQHIPPLPPPRYEPIKAHDYLSRRLNDTIKA